MATMKEIPYTQNFDIILERTRFVLDFEREKYPDEKVSFYLNGTTGELSTCLEDIVRENIPYHIEKLNNHYLPTKGYSAKYDPDLKMVVVYLLYREQISTFRKGLKTQWKEFTRFIIDKDRNVYRKTDGCHATERGYHNFDPVHYASKLNNDGTYVSYQGKNGLPFSVSNFEQAVDSNNYINYYNGEKSGFIKEMSNIFPPVFNISGNDYEGIVNYENLYKYFDIVDNGVTCMKKSGKKQSIIDKYVSYELPPVNKPDKEQIGGNSYESIYKYAVIQKVPQEDNLCVIRTFNYLFNEDVLFEGGRIYVTNKDVNFCKRNNLGEYVAQTLLSKVNHWDFVLDKFSEEETKGTMLEYFGKIISDIEPENRSIAIWMFLKEPFLESLAKISSIDFINSFIQNLRFVERIDSVYYSAFGIKNRDSKKIFQILGINKQQFDLIKDILPECMPQNIWLENDREGLTLGVIPIVKSLLTGDKCGNVSSIDIKKYEDCLDFVLDIYSIHSYNTNHSALNSAIINILDIAKLTLQEFPDFDIRNNFNLFKEMCVKAIKGYTSSYYYDRHNDFRYYRDYLLMVNRLEDKLLYKPKFSNINDMKDMHDNVSLLIELKNNKLIDIKFEERHEIWDKWVFRQDEKTNKKGEILKKGYPFMVIRPNKSFDLAKEGTRLHHCVKSYIERVADGQTNIMFIRRIDEPDTPFFTVEITNDNKINQVHGFGNCNADSEPGLEEFIEVWAKAKRLKCSTINKIRG